ncbi:MAG: ArsR family transcriptional regulator [Clostridiales bacterium]|nr:ArsR family transcriptional regulator [Clostridiales bacterium]MDD7431986.1 metalloregulator ArsR/SmtB family transcription factor [Clostridiales bacterium]MDY3060971.1 metalloregulator ArsR/SmtB family transcription factor [Eubacteriales bacterium]
MSELRGNELSELEQKERLEEFAGEKKHESMGEIVSTFQEGPDSAPQTELFPEVQAELIPETKEKKPEMGDLAAPPRFVLAREETHCYLQLQFPLLLFTDHVPEGMKKLPFDEGQIPPLPWLKAARGALERYEEEIRRYFHPDASVPELLFPLLPLTGQELNDWLSALGQLDAGALRQTLLQGVLPLQEQLSEEPRELSAIAAEDARRFLKQTRLPADACWMIYALLDDLDKIAPELQHLFAELRFLSDAMINPMETDAIVAVDKLLKRFNAGVSDEEDGQSVGVSSQDKQPGAATDQDKLREVAPACPQASSAAAEPSVLPLKLETPDPWLRRLFSEQELYLLLRQDSITVYPSLIPWEARILPGGRALVLGYALADLLTAEEEKEKSEEMEQQNFCKLLSDPTRFKLCKLLAEESARPVELARRLKISQATVSHHLSALRDLGLLQEKRGKKELSKERVAEILHSLLQQFA